VGTLHQITEHRRFDPAVLTLSMSRDLAAAPNGRLAPVVLDRLDGVAAMLARSYPQVGPFGLMSPVTALLSETARRARSAPPAERQRLVRTLAHLGVLAGHMSFDLGQTGYVDGYFGGARCAVKEADDSDMRVWALASWVLCRSTRGRRRVLRRFWTMPSRWPGAGDLDLVSVGCWLYAHGLWPISANVWRC
jgi:hypothetical protein